LKGGKEMVRYPNEDIKTESKETKKQEEETKIQVVTSEALINYKLDKIASALEHIIDLLTESKK